MSRTRVSPLALALMMLAAAVSSAAAQSAAFSIDTTLLNTYRWRPLGPDRGGRSIAVSGVKGRPREAYFGAVGGGLWKTRDGGETWAPVTDGQIRSASVGAVAVSESNPDIVFIGMGETCIRGNIMPGDGVYKSTNGGQTWTHVGLAAAENIAKIRIHPTNPDIIWVAAFGKHSAPNPERGIYKSTDGGRSWRRVLFRNDMTGAVDLSLDANNPNVLYAALWEAFRKEYTMSSGGPGSGLFKSTDGGETWTEITRNRGMPAGMIGRIGVAVSPANSNRVYALVENENGGLFSSDDAGATWTVVNQNRAIRQRAFYYTHVFADPKNADVVYLQNVALFRSTDGGKTTRNLGGTHSDHHDLWIDPDDPNHLVDGNDGGGAVSTNTGQSWSAQDFPTAQWYHVAITKHVPYHVCGAQQDNSTLCVPSDFGRNAFANNRGAMRFNDNGVASEPTRGAMAVAYQAGGGEPGYIAPDPKDPDVFFSGTNNGGFMDRLDRRTGHRREVNPYPWHYSGEPAREIPERWQWTYPIIFSPVDPNVLFTSSQRLWKTTDAGQTWTAISGDLTRHEPSTLGHSGGPITGDMNGPEVYAVIFSIGPSKRNVDIVWTGSDDGLVHVTRDGGRTWANVTPPGMPEFGRVSQIDASSFNDGTAYISVRRPLLDDKTPHIFRTHDFGRTWTKIVNGIRGDDWVHVIREDPTRRGLLYAGTQHGVYISYNDGDNWLPLSLNLPDVPISDLVVETNDVVISTHGRGFYILDDVHALRQYNMQLATAAEPVLFTPPAATRGAGAAQLTYWLKRPAQRIEIDIVDPRGTVARSFTSDTSVRAQGARPSLNAGINRITWDLRYPGATTFPGMILWGASTAGPLAPPGTYTIRMRVDGRELTQPLAVQRHPRYTWISDADLQEQFALGIRIRDKVSEANESVIQIREIKRDAAARMAQNNGARLRELGTTLTTNLSDVEDDIYQVRNQSGQDPLNFPIRINNRLANLLRIINSGDGKPIGNLPVLFQEYSRQLDVQTGRLQQVLARDLAAFNAELRRLGLPVITPQCQPGRTCNVIL
jgi:photosystem II stability/assembly factor-like uncharacterized protein